jgi:hypothetical protein
MAKFTCEQHAVLGRELHRKIEWQTNGCVWKHSVQGATDYGRGLLQSCTVVTHSNLVATRSCDTLRDWPQRKRNNELLSCRKHLHMVQNVLKVRYVYVGSSDGIDEFTNALAPETLSGQPHMYILCRSPQI